MVDWLRHFSLSVLVLAACGKVTRDSDDELWPGTASGQGGGGGAVASGGGGRAGAGSAGAGASVGGDGGLAGGHAGAGGVAGNGEAGNGEAGNGGEGGELGTVDPAIVRVTPAPGELNPDVKFGGGHPVVSGNGRYVVFKTISKVASSYVVNLYRRDLWTDEVELVSLGYDDAPAKPEWSDVTGVSYDGRYVAFSAYALPEDDPEGKSLGQIYLRDVEAGTTELLSATSDGDPGNDSSLAPSLSFDGRFAAFTSRATNFAPGDTGTGQDVFVRDVTAGTTSRLSVAFDGGEPDGESSEPFISGDGRFVAFRSRATNLLEAPAVAISDIYVKDLTTNALELASLAPEGCGNLVSCDGPTLSGDGRYVGFSRALNPEGRNYYRRDRQTGEVLLASVSFDGQAATNHCLEAAPTMSADGRYFAFSSCAKNLVPNDGNGKGDVFVRDFQTGTTFRASVTESGEEAKGWSNSQWISANGAVVVFVSDAGNLVPDDENEGHDVFVRFLSSTFGP